MLLVRVKTVPVLNYTLHHDKTLLTWHYMDVNGQRYASHALPSQTTLNTRLSGHHSNKYMKANTNLIFVWQLVSEISVARAL